MPFHKKAAPFPQGQARNGERYRQALTGAARTGNGPAHFMNVR